MEPTLEHSEFLIGTIITTSGAGPAVDSFNYFFKCDPPRSKGACLVCSKPLASWTAQYCPKKVINLIPYQILLVFLSTESDTFSPFAN